MDERTFQILVTFYRLIDTWPLDREQREWLEDVFNREARERGFSDWREASRAMGRETV